MNNGLGIDNFNISRREGQSWEQACREDRRFWRLRKAERRKLLAWARKEDGRPAQQLLAAVSMSEITTPPPETDFFIPDGMTPEQATREKIKRDAEMYPIETVPYLGNLPVHELAKLEKWMVPPSRRQELKEYRDALRRNAIAERDAKAAALRTSKPGERLPDPRGYWQKNQQGSRHPRNQNITQPRRIDAAKQDCPAPMSGVYEASSRESLAPKELQSRRGHQALHMQPTPAIREKDSLDQGDTGEKVPDTANYESVIDQVSLMSACELQEHLLSDKFPKMPSSVREAITDRFLELEGFPAERESVWQQLEKEAP